MARKMKFTTRMIEALKPGPERYEIWEQGRAGFGLRVTPGGTKSWFYLYRFKGRLRRMTLGRFPEIGLAAAHQLHAEAEGKKERGIDPGKERVASNRREREAPTVKELVEDYLNNISKRSLDEDRRIFNLDVLPAIGRKKVRDIRRRDVLQILDGIIERGSPIQANRTLAAMRRMFNWAIGRDIVLMNPCAAIEPPGREKARDRVLGVDEIKRLWTGLEQARVIKSVALGLKFQLVTVQRIGEVATAEWQDMDLEERIWTIPESKAKNGISHRVPLSGLAVEILDQARALQKRDEAEQGHNPGEGDEANWVFPSRVAGRAVTVAAFSQAVRKNRDVMGVKDVTPHDLRRTGASHIASMGIPRLHISKILNHVESGVTAVYDRYGYDAEKRCALDAWAARLMEIVQGEKPDKVVLFHGRRTGSET
ncbi:tyrosine-type recombinase/integrase [Luteithermobacter gelatinilyticus]|uniref:tyrosine-type recombinase/integrase n=1 Tax=Luteithermobacter gelatinilyticus TaxID=2582913 RepID=UPI001105986D|nr:site-specific integrase [Luteithermobacter gelatinilyticus]